jgi:5-amino-6-(5-phosphoribosylamino)uracil reductase
MSGVDHGRPYVLLSAAMSLDGYLDDASDARLLLSNEADFDRVDAVRAGCDAILVGAHTIRRDNPRLTIRSASRREARMARGLPASPVKVTLTAHGGLDPSAAFFTEGNSAKLVYCGSSMFAATRDRLSAAAEVVDAGDPLSLSTVVRDLAERGVGRLLVEGGGATHTAFLTGGLADELHLVIAPFFVGDSRAPRLVGDGRFPWRPGHPATLAEVTRMDGVVLLRYALSQRYTREGQRGAGEDW